ncbi:hypothetical protein MNBD_UNCLBAC01-1755 [hydrothermal vent metagenome]|uniref:VTT domain-containing protein n=1 Tax=hydrothermal vent metagenome TaxID=652676 RepID=A0A3B1DGX5_9ZZZZ
MESFREPLAQYPIIISGFIFIVLYVLTTTFIWFGPKSIFRILGAILFGSVGSTILVWIAEGCNAIVMFQLSRRLGREFVEKKIGLKSKAVDGVKKDISILSLVALRINPLISFRLMDLGYGLSSITLSKYWLTIFPASLPRIFLFQIILASVGENIFKDPAQVIAYFLSNPSILQWSGLYFLCVLGVTSMIFIRKFIKGKRHELRNIA